MVKCADCGFLGGRVPWTSQGANIPSAGQIIEISERTRKTGGFRDYPSDVLCLAQVIEFPINLPAPDLLAILQEERHCTEFTRWQQGLTPKEHREMLDRKWMMEREDHRDKEMREREDRRDEELRRLQRELHNRELWIIGLLVTGALIIGSVIAAIVEGAVSQGWEPTWWPF